MDKTGAGSSRNTVRTDLSLLLECLKFQMKSPDLQKQALLTIHSICEKREDNVELLREMGGVAFIYNLSKSTIVHSDVKETALFTLGTLAEANVYCKNSLCRKETFADLAGCLMKDDIPLTQKRVSVYLLSVLVANNKSGQTLAQTTGCLDILLDLFRTTFPISTDATLRVANATQTHQLWTSVSSALCACVNNPQNGALASGLAQYGIVSHLVSLLGSPNLDPEDRLSVLLSLVHCTEATVEHQSHLVQCGGLPLIITFLTEDTSEEVRKVATFILQTCKHATLSLRVPGLKIKQGEGENAENVTEMEHFRSSARELLHRIDLLEKRQEAKHEQQDTDLATSAEGLGQPSPGPALFRHLQSVKPIPTAYRQTHTLDHVQAGGDNNITLQTVRSLTTKESGSELKDVSSSLSTEKAENAKTSRGEGWCSVCQGTGVQMSSRVRSLEGRRESYTANSQLFKPPAPVSHSVPKENKCIDGKELKDCKVNAVEEHHNRCAGCVLPFEEVTSRTFASLQSSAFQSCDMHKVLQEATQQFRAHHCNLLFRRKNQDNNVELTDPNSDKVLPAEPQRHNTYWKEICLTPIHKESRRVKSSLPEHHWKKPNGITLNPLYRGVKKERFSSYSKTSPSLTPLKRQHLPREAEKEGLQL